MAATGGFTGKVYINGGTEGAPTWAELDIIIDENQDDKRGEANASSRGSVFKKTIPTLRDVAVNFSMLNDEANAQFLALRTKYIAGTPVDALVCSGDRTATGNTYLRSAFAVLDFSRGAPLENVQTRNVVLKPTIGTPVPTEGLTPLS